MIMHSLERFDKLATVNEIVIVCEAMYRDMIKQMIYEYNIVKNVKFVDAGLNRQESVYNGLQAISNEYVIIHEAARPFVRTEEFQKLIDDSEANITYGYNIPYTVLKGKTTIESILNRSELINVQLPQKFDAKRLLQAHSIAKEKGLSYTEDASLLFDVEKITIKVIRGTYNNIKITDPIDLLLGEIIYKNYITNRR